jgi:hypothetical protein
MQLLNRCNDDGDHSGCECCSVSSTCSIWPQDHPPNSRPSNQLAVIDSSNPAAGKMGAARRSGSRLIASIQTSSAYASSTRFEVYLTCRASIRAACNMRTQPCLMERNAMSATALGDIRCLVFLRDFYHLKHIPSDGAEHTESFTSCRKNFSTHSRNNVDVSLSEEAGCACHTPRHSTTLPGSCR